MVQCKWIKSIAITCNRINTITAVIKVIVVTVAIIAVVKVVTDNSAITISLNNADITVVVVEVVNPVNTSQGVVKTIPDLTSSPFSPAMPPNSK